MSMLPGEDDDVASEAKETRSKRSPVHRASTFDRSRSLRAGPLVEARSRSSLTAPGRMRGPSPSSLGGEALVSQSYDLYDPATNRRQPIRPVEAGKIAGKAWTFYRTLPDRLLSFPDLLRFSLRGVGPEIRLVVMLAVLAGLLGLALPIGSGILVDQVIPEVGLPGLGKTRLLVLTVLLAAIAFSTMRVPDHPGAGPGSDRG